LFIIGRAISLILLIKCYAKAILTMGNVSIEKYNNIKAKNNDYVFIIKLY